MNFHQDIISFQTVYNMTIFGKLKNLAYNGVRFYWNRRDQRCSAHFRKGGMGYFYSHTLYQLENTLKPSSAKNGHGTLFFPLLWRYSFFSNSSNSYCHFTHFRIFLGLNWSRDVRLGCKCSIFQNLDFIIEFPVKK